MPPETLYISIISALLVLVQGIIGWIVTYIVKDLKERLARHDHRMDAKEETDRIFRHQEFKQTAQQVSLQQGSLQALDKKVDQLWARVFNGERK